MGTNEKEYSMNRRTYLSGTAIVTSVLYSGCIGVDLFHDYSFAVINSSDSQHTITIRIENDGIIFEQSFNMDRRTANEDVSVNGVPNKIHIEVDSKIEQEFRWPYKDPDTLVEYIYIWYDPLYQTEQEIFIEHG